VNLTDPPSSPLSEADEAAAAWARLRRFTPARIGLKRAGASIATAPLLDFRRAHAAARDAVNVELDVGTLAESLAGLGRSIVAVRSCAEGRRDYLMRPDLGRALPPASADELARCDGGGNLVVVVADGLSALAVQDHAAPLLSRLLPALEAEYWRLSPIVIASQARVGLGDAICAALGAASVLVLIGERPGLTSPDSLGAYLTWAPQRGVTDADRNCVSNIRPEGMTYDEAARRIRYLLDAARKTRSSGVALKDLSDQAPPTLIDSLESHPT
jgi:ethanolamine ammonia-lyase small subunit